MLKKIKLLIEIHVLNHIEFVLKCFNTTGGMSEKEIILKPSQGLLVDLNVTLVSEVYISRPSSIIHSLL